MNESLENCWLSVPEVADILHVRQRDVRSAINNSELFAVRRGENNAWAIHRDELVDDGGATIILSSLRGTLIALHDAGFSAEEAASWILRHNENIADVPLNALRAGKTHAVRSAITLDAF